MRPIVGFLAEFAPVPRPADWDAPSAALEAERIQGLVDAGREEGLEEGRRLAEADALVHYQSLAEDYTAALAAARADWAAGEGAALAAGLREGLAALEASLAEGLVAAATPFIEPALRSRTVADLGQAVADLMAGGHGALIAIRAPADIVEALRAAWGDHAAVTLEASEDAEVTVDAGDTTIRSQMQAWSDRFEAAFRSES